MFTWLEIGKQVENTDTVSKCDVTAGKTNVIKLQIYVVCSHNYES